MIQAGEFQVMSTGRCMRHQERSVSPSDGLHMFRLTLRPSEVGLARAQEQKRFTAAQRRRRLCVVASPDGRGGSLRIGQDAVILCSVLDAGHHVVHMLEPGRSAWLHIVTGETILQDILLIEGDGAGITDEPSVSLTACASTEVLLIDLGSSPRIRDPEASPREHSVQGDPIKEVPDDAHPHGRSGP
jgi:redox-sensitive bicupin YhaK (pirin superfamily)